MPAGDFLVIDFETTGIPPDAVPVEVAITEPGSLVPLWRSLINPGRFIPPEASAVHHIIDEDVRSAPSWDDAAEVLDETWEVAGRPVLIAHKAAFDRSFFNPAGSRWVCTWKVAMRLWPDSPGYSNQTLRYYLGLAVPREIGLPHRAKADSIVTGFLFDRERQRTDVVDMLEMSAEPPLYPRIPFSKHRNKKWEDIDDGFLFWMLRQKDMDPDLQHIARIHLKSRGHFQQEEIGDKLYGS